LGDVRVRVAPLLMSSVLIGLGFTATSSAPAAAQAASTPPPAPVLSAGRIPHPGQWASFLDQASDLGPSRAHSADVVAELRGTTRPATLIRWAAHDRLNVTWDAGQAWALVSGRPARLGRALKVTIDDFRFGAGRLFYAARLAPMVPNAVRGEVVAMGGISSITDLAPDEVPASGFLPAGVLKAYDAAPLSSELKGQGQTVVLFEVDGFTQGALNAFTRDTGLPSLHPIKLGPKPGKDLGESDLDLETVHEIVPDARIVYDNISNDDLAQQNAAFANAERLYPHSIWSLSLGLCEGFDGPRPAADLESQNSVIAAAEAQGTTVFASSGDTGGLECTPNAEYGHIPENSFFGVQQPASLPAVTGVGGTNLSVSSSGAYLGETAWTESVLSQGSGGGVSNYFLQPTWQVAPGTGQDNGSSHGFRFRQVPDVAADADPSSGTFIVDGGGVDVGGGTSLASPMWAGFMVLIDQFLELNKVSPIGFLNPDLYTLARDSPPYPPFHDITVGGNAAYSAGPGYDMVTGLGSPDVWNLARDLLALQKVPGS
jgi:kumamolisin